MRPQATNLAVSKAASTELQKRLAASRPKRGDVNSLVYVAEAKDKTGKSESGFRPGYVTCRVAQKSLGPGSVTVRLEDGTTFELLPVFKWRAEESYWMDLVGEASGPFSIRPVSAS